MWTAACFFVCLPNCVERIWYVSTLFSLKIVPREAWKKTGWRVVNNLDMVDMLLFCECGIRVPFLNEGICLRGFFLQEYEIMPIWVVPRLPVETY